MQAGRVGILVLGALLAGCFALSAVDCSSDVDGSFYDAGSLDGFVAAEDAPAADTSIVLPGLDAGDASVTPGIDASGQGSDDAGDASLPADAGHDAASNADASDAARGTDASDAATSTVDASDAGSPGTDATAGEDSSTTSDDASVTDAADATTTSDDAGTGADDASDDAADAAVACVSCGTTVSFLGSTAAFVSVGGASVSLNGGTVPDGNTVSAITQTYPKGSATVHLVYATNSLFTGQTDVVMTYDSNQPTPNNDQWFTVLPAQPANTTVYWYVYAVGCDCTTMLYDPGRFANFTYTEL